MIVRTLKQLLTCVNRFYAIAKSQHHRDLISDLGFAKLHIELACNNFKASKWKLKKGEI